MKGHVEKRYKNSFRIVIQLPKDPATGRYPRLVRSIRCELKRDAIAEMNRLMVELQQGTFVKPTRTTLEEYLKTWLQSRSSKIAPKTYQGYELNIRRHILPYLGRKRLHEIQPIDVQNLYDELSKSVSQRTVQYVHAVLRAALKRAVKLRMLAYNPCDAVDAPRPAKKEARALQAHETSALLDAAEESPINDFIVLALHTGARRGELLALRWDDVDFGNGVLNIRQAMTKIKGVEHVRVPKSGKGRIQPLTKTALATLLTRLKASSHALVFCREDGRALDPTTVTHQFAKVAKKAGFPDLTLHGLRHTHASILLATGVGLRLVQDRLGHEFQATTDGYTHIDMEVQRGVAEKFEEALSHRFRTHSVQTGNSSDSSDPAVH
jgi:integrase